MPQTKDIVPASFCSYGGRLPTAAALEVVTCGLRPSDGPARCPIVINNYSIITRWSAGCELGHSWQLSVFQQIARCGQRFGKRDLIGKIPLAHAPD